MKTTVHYTGYPPDLAPEFDSSLDRNQPFTFTLGAGNVIRGWDEGVAGMRVGGKRHLTIPADMGYGAGGSPPVIRAQCDPGLRRRAAGGQQVGATSQNTPLTTPADARHTFLGSVPRWNGVSRTLAAAGGHACGCFFLLTTAWRRPFAAGSTASRSPDHQSGPPVPRSKEHAAG